MDQDCVHPVSETVTTRLVLRRSEHPRVAGLAIGIISIKPDGAPAVGLVLEDLDTGTRRRVVVRFGQSVDFMGRRLDVVRIDRELDGGRVELRISSAVGGPDRRAAR